MLLSADCAQREKHGFSKLIPAGIVNSVKTASRQDRHRLAHPQAIRKTSALSQIGTMRAARAAQMG
ncbi:hypothetical protein [Sandarakinorhabdus sp.]|uniref:hypothetical protein n=1 Tax=Sandarakinorhabdus sp. TaxID=1916663 RepID=UPI003F7276A2